MSGRRPNLQDLTRLLTEGRFRQVRSQETSPRVQASTGGPIHQEVKTGPSEAPQPPSGGQHDLPQTTLVEAGGADVPRSLEASSVSHGGNQHTEPGGETVGSPIDESNGDLTEFVHEVEFQHNTLLGKMQLLREALAKQLAPTDEREDVQKKTFAKWINSQLVKGQHPPVTDLFYDLRDGTRLLALLEVLTNKTYKREKGRMRVHHLNNVSRALNILEEHSVKLVNISNEHIVDGSAKLTLGLVWAIILHWQVQGVLKDVMSDLQQTNLEKTLLAWCRQTTKGYHGVDVRNFTTSWTDGLAFNALIHSHRPQLFDWTVMARKHPYARLENAFRLAHENLNIERLLDPEDVNSQVPDKKSIMMYVMCLFQALPHGSFTMESLDVALQSDSSLSVEGSGDDASHIAAKARPLSTASIGLSEYQRTLEEVLTWLLGAEDRLAAMPPIADTTEAVKDQFHDLEELMLELTSKQGGIGDVLGEGSRLMREGVMEEEEEEEVRVQMKLLNTRWEELRVKAMDRQSSLHEKLMSLQQKQLESLKKWLTDTEDRIANMSQVGPTTEILRQQISAHQSLQQDLENEQSNINSLSNMVVVVDESSSDSAYSTLEDELNALGERWAHICRWAESRWTTLQTLSIHWEHFEQEIDKLRQWLHEKETTLRQVESNPSSEQEHILRHASMLQVLQAEMEVQHRCIGHLEEESSKIFTYIPEESPAHENISAEIESIQDRMDCLVSMIEAQTQRMAASGIDISKVMAPVDDSSNVLSSSTTTISHEGATVVTKIITTKITETVKGSVVKRQKLEGSSQEDFSVALHQLGGWMDSMEAQIKPRAMEELTLEQLSQICQQVESEMDSQKEEYYKVVSLGESAISETSTIGESSKESEQQVANVSSRWEALTEMLIEIRTRITFLTQKKKITTELSDLEVHYQGFLRWFENVRTVSENEPNAVSLQAEQCKSKIAAMESHSKDIMALQSAAKALNLKWAQETHILAQQIDTFYSKWEILVQRFLEWNETLKHKLAEADTPSARTPLKPVPESLLKAMGASSTWLESLEAALATEYSVSTLPQMQDYLTKFKDLSEKVEMEQGNMAHINETCHKLSKDGHVNIMDDITKLNKQWETTTEALQLRIKSIEKVIEKQKQYKDEVSGLKSWLAEVDIFLQAEEAALGDIETLEAQLEQSNALQDDVATLQTNVNNITTTGKQLIDEGDSELKNIVESQLEELTSRWDLVTELARAQNKSLKEALARSQKVHDGIDKLNEWLDELEPKIPSNVPRNTPEELGIAVDTFTRLREDISIHSDDLRAINNIGDEMLQLDSSATHEELARRFTQLNGRWTEVVSQVDSKYKVFITAAQQYEDFKKVCSEESEWLDQLQAKLERSSKDAADAEEISEALDELEIFLHSHDESRLEQIRSLAESLVREGCVSEPVQEITRSLTSRFDTLNAQASEQQSGLEGCVQEAQAWEREYVSVLDYLAQSDLILTQAITDQIQVDQVQVQAELLTQQDVLKKMQAQVEVYHSQGKTEAALRLEDQITHLQKKYEEIEMKLHICRKPSDFDTRFNEMNEQLQEIGQRVHLVNVDSGNPDGIQEQLNQCLDLYQTLSEVKSEVENVIATGRKIVKEGQSTDPDGLTLQLDQLKALYNKLGGTVTEHRGILEKALRHSRKVQKDCSHLKEWLSTTECELDQREATIPAKNIEGEVHFAEHAIDDLGRKKPLLTGLHESYAALASLSDDSASLHPIKEQVDDIALTWERVSIRLANRLKNMQAEQMAKEAEMEKFIISLGEIKGWLESTEHQLLHLSKLEPTEQDKLIKSVSSEIQSYKGQIENTRDTAVDLINHGVLFQARIQPELVLINQRWENIYRTVQTTGIKPSISQLQAPATQVDESKSIHFTLHDDPTAMETNIDMCGKNIEEGNAILKSTGLVRSAMTTSTTVTTTTAKVMSLENAGSTEAVSSDKSDLNTENLQPHAIVQDEYSTNETEAADAGESSEIPKDDNHIVTFVTSSVTKISDSPSVEQVEDINNKLIDQYSSDQKTPEESKNLILKDQPKTLSLVEVEEVKTTISHLSFNIPGTTTERKSLTSEQTDMISCAVGESGIEFSSVDMSPGSELPGNSGDTAFNDATMKDRKRKINENETDLDNFDELIAGLKEVAEKDIDLSAIDRNRRSAKELVLNENGDERFSLLKIRRCEDDDLESLASIDTDMAPASEASRDLEGTFSDLESVSESVSSKGDSLFSPTTAQGIGSLDSSRTEEVHTVELLSQQSQVVSSEAVSHTYIETSNHLFSPSKSEVDSNMASQSLSENSSYVQENGDKNNIHPIKQDETNKSEQISLELSSCAVSYDLLPVEKLQAMIAELEEVMSGAELSDTDDENEKAVKESESINLPITSECTSFEAINAEDEVITSVSAQIMQDKDNDSTSTFPSKISTDEIKHKSLPIEFTVQEVHVAGDIEFAKAKPSVEKSEFSSVEKPRIVVTTTTTVQEDTEEKVPNVLPVAINEQEQAVTSSVISHNSTTVQKVSVHSSQVVHRMTLVTSTEDRLPEAEEAVLVTLISRPSSVEALNTDPDSTLEKIKDVKENVEEEKPSSTVYSSGDSSEVEDSEEKEKRPTVDECSNIYKPLEKKGPEEIRKKKQYPEGSPTVNAGPGTSTSEKVYASRSYVKESTQEQVQVTTSAASTILQDIKQSGQQELGDEVDAFLREVTANADKITEIKAKLVTIPSYQDAKEESRDFLSLQTLEQEVALLEPDVATVISHGDTLTLTTHMVDVPRANTIRVAVNDLRTHWSSLKSETENVKLESERVTQEMKTISGKADDIISWSIDVSKRLHLLNNDESQLEALENEMTTKKAELDKLNESGSLLKKYKYNQIQPVLTLLNMRWTEVSMQFRQYRKGSLEKKSIVSTTKVESPETEPVIVPDFVASVNRLREAISVISRQLNSSKLAGNQYDNLKMQEDELKSIKKGLETLKPRVDGLEAERNATVRNITPAESEQVRRVMDKLREEWAQVNRGYTEKHARWLQCSETWRTLQKTIDDFSAWLDMIEEKVQCTSNQPLPDAKITQKELEKQVTLKHRPSQTLQNMCKEVTESMNADDGKRLQERVDHLMKRWRALLLDLAARRERIASEEGGKDIASSEYDALATWVEQVQALMDAPVNVTDEASLSAHSTMVQNNLVEMTAKQTVLKKLKDSKTKSVTPAQMSTLETSFNKVVKTLPDYKNMVDTKLGVIKTLVADVEGLYKWTEEMRVKVALRNLTEEEIKLSKMTLREKEALYENLDSTYWVLAQDAEGKGLTVAVALKNRMNTIESRLKALQGQVSEAGAPAAAAITPTPTSPTFPTPLPPYSAGGRQKVDQEKAVKQGRGRGHRRRRRRRPVSTPPGTTVTSSVTSVIQNVIKFEESVLNTEGGLRAPSPLLHPPRHAPDSSPVLILASLDKSILQIRDWLTLMEQMTRQQTVVVGDADDIRQLTEKQKSVLRELEGKKPQLDELVASADSLKDDASRTQLHQKASEGDAAVYKFPTHSRLFDHLRTCFKVSKLREHWDETNSVVLARKTQLDAMYTDTHKFDAKRAELESWLARMEARLDRMAPVARTADVLDQQIREQKGFHAEIHQYKHQVELFNQMTQRLIAIYQHDDTRRLKKITETINLRYSSLNSSIIARGKELHSAMNSLHNFDKALDKFASWMSEAESNTDLVELEVDKLGPARRDPLARAPAMHLKLSNNIGGVSCTKCKFSQAMARGSARKYLVAL
ncbi:LOW QUALITY PROTEIN: dystrophin [Procambarus clarkii]|uniref:LOW QUALITY PROTEIN: dystrophin n=1 Tax=Procambarus clarkii TaxID=6728 RepID=UPI003742F07D